MSTERLINDEFLQDHSELVMNSALANYEIRIDGRHRILNSPASSDGKTIYVTLIVSVLAVTGVPWMVINMSALPGLGTSPGNGVSSALNQSFNATSDRIPEAQKEERLQVDDTIAGKVDRDALAATLQSLGLPSASTFPAGPVPIKRSTGVERTGVGARELRSTPKLPTPETRPTTIAGWTMREVINGTALLEGPNGTWMVMPGQTVPNVGRVDSIVRWGNRFIVATSSGLISTP